VHRLQADLRGAMLRELDRRTVDLEHARARLTALGPAATLARGYAIVQRVTDDPVLPVLRSIGDVGAGDRLRVRVADGVVAATVDS
jgi:exodeoxyribonuclease VII large subunit